jgi:hypothetical protein
VLEVAVKMGVGRGQGVDSGHAGERRTGWNPPKEPSPFKTQRGGLPKFWNTMLHLGNSFAKSEVPASVTPVFPTHSDCNSVIWDRA